MYHFHVQFSKRKKNGNSWRKFLAVNKKRLGILYIPEVQKKYLRSREVYSLHHQRMVELLALDLASIKHQLQNYLLIGHLRFGCKKIIYLVHALIYCLLLNPTGIKYEN